MPEIVLEDDECAVGEKCIPSQTIVKIDGKPVIVHGDKVGTAHSTIQATVNTKVKIGGILVCVTGDKDIDGDVVTGTATATIG